MWSYANMLGLDSDLVMHHLTMAVDVKWVKQKLQKMHLEVALLVKAKL